MKPSFEETIIGNQYEFSRDLKCGPVRQLNRSLRNGIVGCQFGSALGDAVVLYYTEFLSADFSAQEYPSRSWLAPNPKRGCCTPTPRQLRSASARRPDRRHWPCAADIGVLLAQNGKGVSARDFAMRLDMCSAGRATLGTLRMGSGLRVYGPVKKTSGICQGDGSPAVEDFGLQSGCKR